MNSSIQISSIILIYQFIYLLLYYLIKNMPDLISWSVLPGLFIICVMYLTNCEVSLKTKIILTIIKVIILILILRISNISIGNYLIGLLFLITYISISNVSKIYKCNVKTNELIITTIVSSALYLYTYLLS